MFFKDLVDVVGIDAWDRALGAQLEWDAIRLLAACVCELDKHDWAF